MASMMSVETMAIVQGRLCTKRLQRSHTPVPGALITCSPRRLARRLGRTRRGPAKASRAGSKVSEPSITSSTAIEAEMATP